MLRRTVSAIVVSWVALGVGAAGTVPAADKMPSVTGTVARVAASQRSFEVTLADGSTQRFHWNAETKISGTLTPGAAVTVRYSPSADGKNLALQVTVSRS